MAEVPSTFLLKPGSPAPDFTLPDFDGEAHTLTDLLSGKKGLLVAFVCNHCPFVIHLAEAFGAFAGGLAEEGIATVAISSNDTARYPADAPDKMAAFALASGWDFPYLYDESQEVAQAYAAACTPDFYLFDGEGRLAYAGQFDDSRPGSGHSPSGADLAAAVDDLLAGSPTAEPWYPSTGCSIKWKPGKEPDYFA
jgi:peroxiredoxin